MHHNNRRGFQSLSSSFRVPFFLPCRREQHKHVFECHHKESGAFSYWRDPSTQHEIDVIADTGERLVPFEVKFMDGAIEAGNLKKLKAFCRTRSVEGGCVITRDAAKGSRVSLPPSPLIHAHRRALRRFGSRSHRHHSAVGVPCRHRSGLTSERVHRACYGQRATR